MTMNSWCGALIVAHVVACGAGEAENNTSGGSAGSESGGTGAGGSDSAAERICREGHGTFVSSCRGETICVDFNDIGTPQNCGSGVESEQPCDATGELGHCVYSNRIQHHYPVEGSAESVEQQARAHVSPCAQMSGFWCEPIE